MEKQIIDAWVKLYLDQTLRETDADPKKATKGCSQAHFAVLGMENILRPFVGKQEEFVEFLKSEWQWNVRVEPGKITADENKNFCVCPLVKQGLVASKELCRCSEGFAERMFSFVLQKPVAARVVRSYLRDGTSCVYELTFQEPA